MQIKMIPEKMTKIADNMKRISEKFDDIVQDVKGVYTPLIGSSEARRKDQKLLIADRTAKNIANELSKMSQNLIEARDRMIEADNKASAASRKMKIADFIKLVTTVLLPNPLPGWPIIYCGID